jgi:transcriptional regulator GlxA family with amidase domain
MRQHTVMSNQRDVHVLVLDTLADWELGLAIAHVNRPAPGVASRYRVRFVGLDRSPVRTIGGMTITPDLALAELRPEASAMLILPGADIWSEPRTDPALAAANAYAKMGIPIAAICGATLGLARAGLLDDRRHTSNAPAFLASTGYGGASHYVDAHAVEDRGVITASAMAPLDFAHLVLARLEVFTKVALDAWYGLYKTGEASYFVAFMKALEDGRNP